MKKLLPVILILITFCSCEQEQILEGEDSSPSTFKTIAYLNTKARNLSQDNPDAALKAAEEALRLSTEVAYLEGQKQSHNALYFLYLNQFEDLEKAEYHSNAFIELTDEVQKAKDLAYANYKQGTLLYRNGELTKAMPYLFEAYDLYLKDGNLKIAGYSLYTISMIFEKVGKPKKGLFYVNKISLDAIDDSFLWAIHHHKARLNVQIEDYQKAKNDFNSALRIVSQLDLPKKELNVLNGLTLAYIELGEFELAERNIDKGLALAKNLAEAKMEATFYLKKGYLNEVSLGYSAAIEWYLMAYQAGVNNNLEPIILDACLDLSKCFYYTNDFDNSEYYARQGVAAANDKKTTTVLNLYKNLSLVGGTLGDSVAFYKFQNNAEQIRTFQLENSEYVGVSKAELDYKGKVLDRNHNAYVERIHKEMASDERRGNFYLMGFGFMCACVLLLIAIRRPAQFFMKNAERAMLLIEDLHAAFKKRLAGEGPPLPKMKPLTKPEPPDERDIHNLWRKDRHGRKGDKDKGKDDPAPGLDDE